MLRQPFLQKNHPRRPPFLESPHNTGHPINTTPLSHIGSRTPLHIYWRPQSPCDCSTDVFAPVLSLAHRWVSLFIDSRHYSGTFGPADLYTVAPSLKRLHVRTHFSNALLLSEYPLSSNNLEYLELEGPKLIYWSSTSFLHLKTLVLSTNST